MLDGGEQSEWNGFPPISPEDEPLQNKTPVSLKSMTESKLEIPNKTNDQRTGWDPWRSLDILANRINQSSNPEARLENVIKTLEQKVAIKLKQKFPDVIIKEAEEAEDEHTGHNETNDEETGVDPQGSNPQLTDKEEGKKPGSMSKKESPHTSVIYSNNDKAVPKDDSVKQFSAVSPSRGSGWRLPCYQEEEETTETISNM